MDLCRKKLGRAAFGLTLPLITKADERNSGRPKPERSGLNPKRTSTYRFLPVLDSTDDRDVIPYLKIFPTFLTQDEIVAYERQHAENPGARTAHAALAKAVLTWCTAQSARRKLSGR